MSSHNIVVNTISAVLSVFLTYSLFDSLATVRFKKPTCLLSIGTVVIIFTAILCFVKDRAINLFLLVVLTLVVSCLFHMKWYNRIIFSLLHISISVVAEIVVAGMMALLFSIDMEIAGQGLYYVLGLLLSKFVTFFIILLIRFGKHKVLFGPSKKETSFIIILPISTMAVMLLQYSYFIEITNASYKTAIMSIVCYSLLILSNILVFYIIDTIYFESIKDAKLEAASDIIAQQETQYEQLVTYQKDILKIRHDQKNYLLGVIGAIEEGKVNDALSSLRKEYTIVANDPIVQSQRNGIIHLIVANKSQQALHDKINIEFTYRDLDQIKISSIDLAIILGNLLDNAIEATGKVEESLRLVELFISAQKQTVIIHVKNPTAHTVDVSNLRTTKYDSLSHGFGILSVKSVSAKYHGDIAFSCENNIFQTTVMLINE